MAGYDLGVFDTELYGDVGGLPRPPYLGPDPAPVTVRMHALDGVWEVTGADRARGVWPEALRASADDWGSSTCSFTLRRDPGQVFPDLLPFTPVELEVAGAVCWSGFVWEPPQEAGERAIAVECRGDPFHLDDDLVDRLYVHSQIGSWRDTRSMISTDLATWGLSGTAESGDGTVVIGWAQGTEVVAGQKVGVTLDLGRAEARRVVLSILPVGLTAALVFVVRGHDSGNPDVAGSFEDVVSLGHDTLATGFVSGTFTVPRRFVTVYLTRPGAGTASADNLVRVLSAKVFRETVHESGGQSVLKASDVFRDVVPYAPKLDQRTDLIQTSDVALPDFSLEDNTPRQGVDQANSVQGWQARVTPERLPEYRPRPTVPLFRFGAWAGGELSGASRGSGEPIHNRVVVKGTDSSGSAVNVERYAGQQPGVPLERIDSPSLPNPSADTDDSGWSTLSPGVASIHRDTAVFDSAPASVRWDDAVVGDALTTHFSGTFERDIAYVIEGRIRGEASALAHRAEIWVGEFDIGSEDYSVALYDLLPTAGAFTSFAVAWVPRIDQSSATFRIWKRAGGGLQVWVDSLTVNIGRPTLPDRRGFLRTRGIRVSRAVNETDAQRFADASLREAMRTQFKGDLTVFPGGVRTFLGDAAVHPAHLLRHTGELVHASHLIDPDNGSLGRDARIVGVAFDDDGGFSQVSLDNARGDFERQLSRYEVTGRR